MFEVEWLKGAVIVKVGGRGDSVGEGAEGKGCGKESLKKRKKGK